MGLCFRLVKGYVKPTLSSKAISKCNESETKDEQMTPSIV